jgi:hypothetical protein
MASPPIYSQIQQRASRFLVTSNLGIACEPKSVGVESTLCAGDFSPLKVAKKAHFPKDRRRILICGGTPHGTIYVEWLPPAAPGVDVKWETQLYSLVRVGKPEDAVRFLQRTRNMSGDEAAMQVAAIRMQLGLG